MVIFISLNLTGIFLFPNLAEFRDRAPLSNGEVKNRDDGDTNENVKKQLGCLPFSPTTQLEVLSIILTRWENDPQQSISRSARRGEKKK